jgi:hypothetical protein
MMKRDKRAMILLLGISALVVAVLACEESTPAPGEIAAPSTTDEAGGPLPAPAEESAEEPVEYDTVFPLPDDVRNFTGEGGEGMVNFQTSLILDEAIDFYRHEFTDLGLTEREILTVIEDTAFSMVFDGWPNGKAVVIQGVEMEGGSNINIRFEDL